MSPADRARLHRVVLIGTSGAGKTTVGERLARCLGQPFVELDELFWSADWQPKPSDAFRALVREAAAGERWVAAGNYSSARAELWTRATAVVWLRLALPVVLWRVVGRTLRRLVRRQVLWHGNRESWSRTLFSRDSIVWWTITTHRSREEAFAVLRASGAYPNLHWLEFTRRREIERFLADACSAR